MSRIYDNKPLASVSVSNHSWSGKWDPKALQSGKGIILEGRIQGRSKHVITDSGQNKVRYIVLHVAVSRAHRRQYDSAGKEVEPNFSQTGKVRTGYLHSSYKVEAKGETDLLTTEATTRLLSQPDLDAIISKYRVSGCSGLWMEEQKLEQMELSEGEDVRVKTLADSPFIDTIAKLDVQSSTVSNYAGGEAVGGSWTDKVLAVKSDLPLPQDQNEGVDEDEWDD